MRWRLCVSFLEAGCGDQQDRGGKAMTRDRYGRSDEGGFSRRRDEADTNTYDRDRSYRRPFSRTREYDYDESYRRDRERFEAGQRDYAGGRGEYGGRSEYPYNESRN